MFYNVENFFDCHYDSTISYNEFTPHGKLHWTYNKYLQKRNSIFKVIQAIGGWKNVSIVGLAEIENEFVISDLIDGTPLSRLKFQYVHFESKDQRGLDVGLIYNPDHFEVVASRSIPIRDPDNPDFTSRDILYIVGLLGGDTVNVFVNHWTSRYRGLLESEHLRMLCSNRLKSLCDSICSSNSCPSIIIMGDFNDDPENSSLINIVNSEKCNLKNLTMVSDNGNANGSLKFQNRWFNFDQFLVSESLFNANGKLQCDTIGHIFDANFLLESDHKYLGYRIYRSNIGYKYHGGISDHLPIYLDIIKN